MILLMRRRSIGVMFTGLFFLGLSLGAYRLATHPEMNHWVDQKLVVTRVQTNEKVVALTFDDGPDSVRTLAILDSLRKHHAQATFFVMGTRVEQHPALIHKMITEGHEIGNHSWSHADYRNKSADYLSHDITRTNEMIYRMTGQKPTLFRPPGGFLSTDLVKITKKMGLTIAYWSYETDSKDWVNGQSAHSIANHVVKGIKPGQIIILHDGCSNSMQTANAVDLILKQLTLDGYRFVTMSELIKLENKE